MKKPEILAPCSTPESVTAALNAGCDAIYIGGSAFGARAYAENPSDDTLHEIIKTCVLRGVKVLLHLTHFTKKTKYKRFWTSWKRSIPMVHTVLLYRIWVW